MTRGPKTVAIKKYRELQAQLLCGVIFCYYALCIYLGRVHIFRRLQIAMVTRRRDRLLAFRPVAKSSTTRRDELSTLFTPSLARCLMSKQQTSCMYPFVIFIFFVLIFRAVWECKDDDRSVHSAKYRTTCTPLDIYNRNITCAAPLQCLADRPCPGRSVWYMLMIYFLN